MSFDSDIAKNFPINDKIYLNNASVSLMPLTSIKAMTDFLVTYNEMGSDSYESEIFVTEKLSKVRESVSKLLKCKREEVILTQSTTDGVNLVANGLKINSESNIIIRGLEHEHHANYFPWLYLSNRLTVKNLEIDKHGFFGIKKLKSIIDENTKLVALSHALYNTGAILPIEQIGEILEKNNIPYFLDTAQTIGCIGEFDIENTKCDFMAFNGSKWLCGPMGTGIFYCNRNSSYLLEPHQIGGESAMIYDEHKLAFKDIPDKFQTGFRNYVGMVGLDASINFLLNYGLQNIRNKILKLANLLRDELSKISEITLYGPEEPEKRTSIVSFNIKNRDPEYIVKTLEKQNIVLAQREILDKKIVRASPHFFNSELEILKVIESIKKL